MSCTASCTMLPKSILIPCRRCAAVFHQYRAVPAVPVRPDARRFAGAMLSQAGYSSVDEYLESSESSKQNMIKQILIMQALAEKNNIVCDTDILKR